MREPVEEWLGVTVETGSDGYARVKLVVAEKHLNGGGFLHGGIIFTLADIALAHAAILPGAGVTANAQIAFISPAIIGEEITAVTSVRSRWGRNLLVDVIVQAGEKTIAEFRGQAQIARTKS